MKIIGSLEVVRLPMEDGKRFCIRLNKPNIDDVRTIKSLCHKQNTELGLYNVFEDYHFERIGK